MLPIKNSFLTTGYILTIFIICFTFQVNAQNNWQPDSTAYQYLSKGENLEQFRASGLTTVSKDIAIHNTHSSSIKWVIPANSGDAALTLFTGDMDLSNKVLYTICKRNNIPNTIYIYANTKNGSRFKIGPTTKVSQINFALPETEWHQMGSYVPSFPENNANPIDLQHVKSITFEAVNAGIDVSLWIDEIKTIVPTGPVCIAHFNRFRSNADSLLVPFLLQKNLKANLDVVYSFAKKQLKETKSGLTYNYVGLGRIDTLVHQHGWSCTSHGSYYDRLPYLSDADQYRLCALDSFVAAGLDAQWCFSIPTDDCTPAIFKKIKDWNFYRSVRKQDQGVNELPIDNPYNLRFFRPTSASAGSNVGGNPLTQFQMKAYIDSVKKNKGIIILDFGSILTDSSTLFHESELTMKDDAFALINYADSLHLPFITFEDLYKPDPGYSQKLTASDDYYFMNDLNVLSLNITSNDMAPIGSSLIINIIDQPLHGIASVSSGKINYTPGVSCFDTDKLTYSISDGIRIDTALVTIQRMSSKITALKTGYCNPNSYSITVNPVGGTLPHTFLWSDNSTTASINANGADTLYVTITDGSNCVIQDSIILTNLIAPIPFTVDSIQCGTGVPFCIASGSGNILWYDAPSGGNLLQTGGNTYNTSISTSTTFYVAADYGTCISDRIAVTSTFDKPNAVILADSDTILCDGQRVKLTGTTDPGLSYKWYKNGIAVANGIADNLFVKKTGNYYLQVTRAIDNCVNNSNSIYVSVIDTPVISVSGNLTFCAGDSILISAPLITGATYTWYNNLNLIPDAIQNFYYVKTAADYKSVVTYPQGCSLPSNTLTSIINCTVGLDESNKNDFHYSLTPNPSSSNVFIHFEIEKTQNILIEVVDVNGKKINTLQLKNVPSGKHEYNLSEKLLLPGIYSCKIKTEKQTYNSQFVIIR